MRKESAISAHTDSDRWRPADVPLLFKNMFFHLFSVVEGIYTALIESWISIYSRDILQMQARFDQLYLLFSIQYSFIYFLLFIHTGCEAGAMAVHKILKIVIS